MSDVEKKPSPDHHLYVGFMDQLTKRDDMPALPEPAGVVIFGTQARRAFISDQMHAYALQYAEQRVREEREACAATADRWALNQPYPEDQQAGEGISAAIRQRSKP